MITKQGCKCLISCEWYAPNVHAINACFARQLFVMFGKIAFTTLEASTQLVAVLHQGQLAMTTSPQVKCASEELVKQCTGPMLAEI